MLVRYTRENLTVGGRSTEIGGTALDGTWIPPQWVQDLVDDMAAFEVDPENSDGGEILGRDGQLWVKLPIMERLQAQHLPTPLGAMPVDSDAVWVWWELGHPAAAWTLAPRQPPPEIRDALVDAAAGDRFWARPRIGPNGRPW